MFLPQYMHLQQDGAAGISLLPFGSYCHCFSESN